MADAVEMQKSVNFSIEEPTHIQAREPQCRRDQVDVLRNVSGFQQYKPIAPVAVCKRGPFEQRGQEDQDGRL